jgi:hypothetical protein
MPVVTRELIEHELHVDPNGNPVKQHLQCFAQDKKYVIKRAIARVLDAEFIKEVHHPDWVANPILVPKKIKNGGCVLIILISTISAKMIRLTCPELIKLWTPWQDAVSWASWIITQVSLDPPQGQRSDQDVFHYPIRCILLYNNALQTQKCYDNVPEGYTKVSP